MTESWNRRAPAGRTSAPFLARGTRRTSPKASGRRSWPFSSATSPTRPSSSSRRRRPEVLEWARALYEALVSAEAGSSSSLSEVVDGIGAELDLASRAFGPVVADLGLSIAQAQSCAEQARAALTAAQAESETRERERIRLRGDLADALARTRQLELAIAGKRLTEPLRRVLRRSPRAASLVRSALRVAKLPSWTKVRSLLGGLARASAGRPDDEVGERSQEERRRPHHEVLARGRVQQDQPGGGGD